MKFTYHTQQTIVSHDIGNKILFRGGGDLPAWYRFPWRDFSHTFCFLALFRTLSPGEVSFFFYYSFPAFLFCGVTLWFLCAPCGFSCVCSVRSRCDWRLVFSVLCGERLSVPAFISSTEINKCSSNWSPLGLLTVMASLSPPPTCHHPAPPHPSPAPSASSFWVSLLVLVSVLGLGWVLVWFVYGFGYWFWLWYGYRSRCLCRRCVVWCCACVRVSASASAATAAAAVGPLCSATPLIEKMNANLFEIFYITFFVINIRANMYWNACTFIWCDFDFDFHLDFDFVLPNLNA